MLPVLAMMGQQEKQQEMWAEPVNLGRLIPEDAPLRQINRELRLDFVREEVARFYGRNGASASRTCASSGTWGTRRS